MNKIYLGDSVYVDCNDARQIVLTTENGYGPTNTIYLEREVFEQLLMYVRNLDVNPQWLGDAAP